MVWPFKTSQTVEFIPTTPIIISTPSLLRKGMWVNAAGRIGILTEFLSADTVQVTHTRADGSTLMALNADDQVVPTTETYPVTQVQQATISEIPKARYESVEQLHSLGYKE